MGPDSQPRRVLSVTKGYGPLVRVVPRKGTPWVCNDEHVLSLTRTNDGVTSLGGQITDVPVKVWAEWSKTQKHLHKLFRVPVDFPPITLPIHPYLLGVLLGDGSLTNRRIMLTSEDTEVVESAAWLALSHGVNCYPTRSEGRTQTYLFTTTRGQPNPLLDWLRLLGLMECRSGDKFIPGMYKTSDRSQRLQLLAGLLDTDGHLNRAHFDYVSKSQQLSNDLAHVARSVGLAAYVTPRQVDNQTYWRVSISGNVDAIPTRIPRKKAPARKQKKDVLKTGFRIEPIGPGDYYGFTLEGDGRFLLGDFTVTHNTEMAAEIIHLARAKGSKVLFIADRLALVDQAHNRLQSYGIPHGIIQAGQPRDPHEPIQIASAQTLERMDTWPHADLTFIDEVHNQRKHINKFVMALNGLVVGLTATPTTYGLGDVYTNVVMPVTTNDLLKSGDLAPLHFYSAREIDMTGAKKVAGEWTANSVSRRVRAVVGDVVSEWYRHTHRPPDEGGFGGPVPTLVYSADVNDGKALVKAFRAAGFDFRQTTHHDSLTDTLALLRDFNAGKFTGLISVEKLAKGYDAPAVKAIVGTRHYSTSLTALLQQLGRGMRSAPGKDFCLYLDHTGNIEGWWPEIQQFWANGVNRLKGKKAKNETAPMRREGEDRPDVTCGCGYLMPPQVRVCPMCGHTRPQKRRRVRRTLYSPGRMVKLDGATSPGSRAWTWAQVCSVVARMTTNPDKQLKTAKYHFKTMTGTWPDWGWGFSPSSQWPDKRIKERVYAQARSGR